MILIIHHNDTVLKLLNDINQPITEVSVGRTVTDTLMDIAKMFPNTLVLWCQSGYEDFINQHALPVIFHHKRILASYNPSTTEYLPKQIGYLERSYHSKINKNATFPTWQMSSFIGGVNTDVLNNLSRQLQIKDTFGYFLNSLGKRAITEGLFCYSEPSLLNNNSLTEVRLQQADIFELFKFAKQHYKWIWVWFLGLCYLIFEKRNALFPFLRTFFYEQRDRNFNLESIPLASKRKVIDKKTIDVVIPTIGREKYLYNVLQDFGKQTLMPKKIIIVEQNPNAEAKSSLDYLKTEKWPFKVQHIFTHKTGVCNARNVALSYVESEWTFLGDDDNRFDENLLEDLFQEVEKVGAKVATTLYIQPHEKQTYFKTSQTTIFGAGNSMIKSSLLNSVKFDTKFEFNYGEDTDFGMQLRHLGEDVIFFSNIKITHLKAPIGGYRTKVNQLWDDDIIQPKPSPTIMLLKQRYFTNTQLKGYKLLLFFKYYKSQSIKNPFRYIKHFKLQWKQSEYWSSLLMQQNA